MNSETLRILDSIARDRHIERDVLIHDLEQAMVSAARKHFNSLDTEEFGCRMDPMTGELTLWRNHPPTEIGGEATREVIPLEAMGRIPAQTAKQVMIQKFREDERNSLLDEFGKRQGEVVTGTAHRYEGGALVVSIDRAEGFMPRSEQIPTEQFHAGDRVRCLILDVREAGSQVKIVLSRRHNDFIRKLFEAEVPEVAERVIEIKAMAREAGFRTKIAVSSIDSKVDPVGACVGVRGSRIKNIVDELAGEKIDIVRWNESSQILIANALKPAEVEDVSLCFELGRGTVIVREDQLSLAIGRRGQNVRLAARLTGWDLDVLTPQEFSKGLEVLEGTIREIEGVTPEMLDRMGALGLISVYDVEEVGIDVLEQEVGMSPETAEAVLVACGEQAKILTEQQARDKEEEARRKAADEAATAGILQAAADGTPGAPGAEVAGAAAAASILGEGPAPTPAAPADAGASDEAAGEAAGESSDEAAGESSDEATGEAANETTNETVASASDDAAATTEASAETGSVDATESADEVEPSPRQEGSATTG